MSIIYEALKKLENENKTIDKPKQKYIFIFITSLSILPILFSIYFFKCHHLKIKEKPKLEKFSKILINEKENAPLEKKNKYKLEGIMFDNQNPVVLINKKILKVGDKIEDAEILNIYPDKVELKTQEGIEYLTLD